MAVTIGQHLADLGRETAAIRFSGDRATLCTAIALAVVLSVTVAQWASLDDPWWAAISGMMASQATRPASIARVVLRIAGTVMGTALGSIAIGLFAYDHVALCLFMFAAATVGMIGLSVSPHGYAWMLGGLTANMIVIMAMNDPSRVPYIAVDRIVGVGVGCGVAVLVALALQPDGDGPAAAPAPGWTDLLGAQWPAVEHAVRCGLAVMLMPVIWNMFDLPSLSQMAITATAVMAVPVSTDNRSEMRSIVAGRGVLRILGCLLGGLLGLICLGIQLTSYPLWLLVLFGGVWICAHVQASKAAISYSGNQAAIVFIVMIVQGFGPPDSLAPGVERLAGILGGLSVLLLIGLVLWPSPRPAHPN